MKAEDVNAMLVRTVAEMLDHPSIYMGGPSQRNTRRAEQILAAVALPIQRAEREKCARALEREGHHIAAAAIRALD